MGKELAITLSEAQQTHLETLAAERAESADALASRTLASFLDQDAAFRKGVEEGLIAYEAGDVYSLDEVAAEMRALIATDGK